MRQWSQEGYFDDDLPLRQGSNGDFHSFKLLFANPPGDAFVTKPKDLSAPPPPKPPAPAPPPAAPGMFGRPGLVVDDQPAPQKQGLRCEREGVYSPAWYGPEWAPSLAELRRGRARLRKKRRGVQSILPNAFGEAPSSSSPRNASTSPLSAASCMAWSVMIL